MEGSEGHIELSVKEKQAVIQETYQWYQRPGKKDKTKIFDELTQSTGLNRKYLLILFRFYQMSLFQKFPETV
jgi:hypothetical protein